MLPSGTMLLKNEELLMQGRFELANGLRNLFKYFGFTVENLLAEAEQLLEDTEA